jgi:hypothetical protein
LIVVRGRQLAHLVHKPERGAEKQGSQRPAQQDEGNSAACRPRSIHTRQLGGTVKAPQFRHGSAVRGAVARHRPSPSAGCRRASSSQAFPIRPHLLRAADLPLLALRTEVDDIQPADHALAFVFDAAVVRTALTAPCSATLADGLAVDACVVPAIPGAALAGGVARGQERPAGTAAGSRTASAPGLAGAARSSALPCSTAPARAGMACRASGPAAVAAAARGRTAAAGEQSQHTHPVDCRFHRCTTAPKISALWRGAGCSVSAQGAK